MGRGVIDTLCLRWLIRWRSLDGAECGEDGGVPGDGAGVSVVWGGAGVSLVQRGGGGRYCIYGKAVGGDGGEEGV